MLRFLLFLLAAGLGLAATPVDPYREFILAAGNAETDPVRLAHLRKLAYQCKADGTDIAGLDNLIAFVERWDSPETRLQFFKNEIQKAQSVEMGVESSSPLFPIAAFYQARMLVWTCLEYSEIYPFPEERAKYLGKARRYFELVARAFPENRIARMYLGEPIPSERRFAVPAGAPAWAVAQREGLERLTDIVDWWIDHRLRPNGEYGGAWGDDCEMWRWWVPVMIAFEHPRATWAQTFLSTRLLAQPHLAGGYHNRMMDVEHTSEDVADALTPMMFLAPGNPEWAGRVNRLVDLAENLWTGRNQRGLLQFKSAYFTASQVDLAAERACDTVYHPRALQPALLYWQRTGDSRIGKLMTDWMRTWVEAAAREEHGKPAGIVPTAIHWPDGRAGGAGDKWWLPENYSSPLYDYPSAMTLMLNTLVLTAHMTGDKSFLEPVRSLAAARLDWIEAGRPTDAPEGSRLWCASLLDELGGVIAKYRFTTGDTSFDGFLREESEVPYVHYRMSGGAEGLASVASLLDGLASVLRVNFPSYTQEVRFTDRVLRFPVLYEAGWMSEKGSATPFNEAGVNAASTRRMMLLYQTATGDPGDPLYFPLNAVRWHTSPRDIAALVTETSPTRFAARLFHFGSGDRAFNAELFTLTPGDYTFELSSAGGAALQRGTLRLTEKSRMLPLKLPSGTECILQITRASH